MLTFHCVDLLFGYDSCKGLSPNIELRSGLKVNRCKFNGLVRSIGFRRWLLPPRNIHFKDAKLLSLAAHNFLKGLMVPIGASFILKIKSGRWPRPDDYIFTKSLKGWHLKHIYDSAECDKFGRPLLKKLFKHEQINYNFIIEKYLSDVWDKSNDVSCSKEFVQQYFEFINKLFT